MPNNATSRYSGIPYFRAPIHWVGFLSPTEVVVAIAIGSYANENLQCWPSIASIADKCNLSRPTVKRTIKSLEEKNVLSISRRYGEKGDPTSNLYQINVVVGSQTNLGRVTNEPRVGSQVNLGRLVDEPRVGSNKEGGRFTDEPRVGSQVNPELDLDQLDPITRSIELDPKELNTEELHTSDLQNTDQQIHSTDDLQNKDQPECSTTDLPATKEKPSMATRIFNTRDFTPRQMNLKDYMEPEEWENHVLGIRASMTKETLVFHEELDLVRDLINRWIEVAETKETYGSIQESMNNLVDVYLYNDINTVAKYLEHCIQYRKTELAIGEAEELSELSESDWMIPDTNSKPSFGIHLVHPYCEKLITITYEGNQVDGWFLPPEQGDDEVVFVVESNKARIPIYWEDALRLVTT